MVGKSALRLKLCKGEKIEGKGESGRKHRRLGEEEDGLTWFRAERRPGHVQSSVCFLSCALSLSLSVKTDKCQRIYMGLQGQDVYF